MCLLPVVWLLLCFFLLFFLVPFLISFLTCSSLAAHFLYFKPECFYLFYALHDSSPPGRKGTHLNSNAVGTDLSGKFSLPLSGNLRGGVDLLLAIGGLSSLVQLLSDARQRGLLPHQHSGLELLPQQKVMFGLFHLRQEVRKTLLSPTTKKNVPQLKR